MAVALVAMISGCGAGGYEEAPGPTPTAGELATHLAKCQQGIEEWKRSAGKVDYPKTLVLRVDQPTTYNAAIDIGDAPLPADEVITVPSGEPTSGAIQVQCGVAARLVPVGDLTVTPAEDTWVTQEFSPSGVAEWAWTVSTSSPSDKQLRLEIQPAQLGNGVPLAGGGNVAMIITQVPVEGTYVDRMAYWFATQWPKLVAVAGLIGAAALGVLGWLGRLHLPRRKKDASTTTNDTPATIPGAADGQTADRTSTMTG